MLFAEFLLELSSLTVNPTQLVLAYILILLFKNERELRSNLPLGVPSERTVMNRCSHMEAGGRHHCPSCLSLGRICVLAPPEPSGTGQERGASKIPWAQTSYPVAQGSKRFISVGEG